jgi:hypothetical protein
LFAGAEALIYENADVQEVVVGGEPDTNCAGPSGIQATTTPSNQLAADFRTTTSSTQLAEPDWRDLEQTELAEVWKQQQTERKQTAKKLREAVQKLKKTAALVTSSRLPQRNQQPPPIENREGTILLQSRPQQQPEPALQTGLLVAQSQSGPEPITKLFPTDCHIVTYSADGTKTEVQPFILYYTATPLTTLSQLDIRDNLGRLVRSFKFVTEG